MRVQFGEYELDTGTFRLMSNGHEVFVEPQVFDLLAYLIENRDRVVPKTELLDKVWGNRFVSESALTSRVKSARRAVGDDGAGQQVIRTQRGRATSSSPT
jgi:DNA-binding winged helix-turn-helix (wHTH) protein